MSVTPSTGFTSAFAET